MSSADISYYRQRAVEERARALASDRQNVREIHEELARQYDALVLHAELRPAAAA
jgi:hypothetical protein